MFMIGSTDPWYLAWNTFPTRIVAVVVTAGPAYLVALLSHNFQWAVWTYALTFAVLPVVSIIITYRIDPLKGILACCCAYSTAVVSLFVVFFPTEIWLTHAMYWPILAYALGGKGKLYPFLLPLLFTMFSLTHEAGAVVLPLLALVAALHSTNKTRLVVIFSSLAAAAVIWISVKSSVAVIHGPTQDVVARNTYGFFAINGFVNRVSKALVLSYFIFGLCLFALQKSRLGSFPVLVAVGLAAGMVALFTVSGTVHAQDRYSARLILFAWLVVFSLGAALVSVIYNHRLLPTMLAGLRRQASRLNSFFQSHRTFAWRFVLGSMVIAGSLHVVEAARFARMWLTLQDKIHAYGNAPSGSGGGSGPIKMWPVATDGPEWRLIAWDWALPFHSLAVSQLRGGYYLIHSDNRYVPLYCNQIAEIRESSRAIDLQRVALLERYACQDHLPHLPGKN